MLNLLIKLTSKATHNQQFHAVLVKRGGAVIASGYNHRNIHAEYHALNQLWPNEREGTTVWSIRVRKSGKLGLAKPCPECLAFLIENRVKTIVYSTNEGKLEKIRLRY